MKLVRMLKRTVTKRQIFAFLALFLVLFVVLYTVRSRQQIRQKAATRVDVPLTIIAASDFQSTGSSMLTTTSNLALTMNADYVLTVGDYSNEGTAATYTSSFTPTWGRLMGKIYPAPGNHDRSSGNLTDYLQYFNSRYTGTNTYYSVNLGAWHIVSLDSGGDIAAQTAWLQQDLAANPGKPILAFWHQPLWSTDSVHGNNPAVKPWWDALYAAHADVVVNGHVHAYQRYAQMDGSGALKTDGIREFTTGTAGDNVYSWSGTDSKEEYRDNTSGGFMRLTLTSTAYGWAYVKSDGQVIDQGSAAIHNMPAQFPTNTPEPTVTIAPTIEPISPTWYCSGSGNCVPSTSPTPTATAPTEVPEITDTPYPTQSFVSPTIDPCASYSATASTRELRGNTKPKHGVGSMMKEFIQKLFDFFFQLIFLILSGKLNPTPTPTPTTVPTTVPTNLPPTNAPTSVVPTSNPTVVVTVTGYPTSTAAPQPTVNPCAHLTPSVTPVTSVSPTISTGPTSYPTPTSSLTPTTGASPTVTATSTPTASPLTPSPLLTVTTTPEASASPTVDPCANITITSVRESRSTDRPKKKHKHNKKKNGGVGNMMKMMMEMIVRLLDIIFKLITNGNSNPKPTPTPTSIPQPTATTAPSAVPSATIEPTGYPTSTAAPTINPCLSRTPSPTNTPAPSPTLTPTITPSPTPDDQTPTEIVTPTYSLIQNP